MIIPIIAAFHVLIFFIILYLIIKINKIYLIKSYIKDSIVIFNKNGKIFYKNSVFFKMFNLKKNQRYNFKDIFLENDLTVISKNNLLMPEVNKNYTWRAKKEGQDDFLIDIEFNKFNKNLYIAVIKDLSKHNIGERKIRESHRLISTLINNLPGIVYLAELTDNKRVMKFVSEGAYELTGYYASELIDNNKIEFDCIIKSDDMISFKDIITNSINQNEAFLTVYRIKTGDGNEKWIMDKGKPIFSNEKKLLAIGGVISDITENKIIQKALEEEKEKLSVTLRSIGEAVITTNINGNVELLNEEAEKLTEWTLDEAIGKELKYVFNIKIEDADEQYNSHFHELLINKELKEYSNNSILISKNKFEKLISYTLANIKDKKNNIIGLVIVFKDITEKTMIDEEMRNIQKLESLGILAGGIAHDFNNLLTLILGNINLAKYYCENNNDLLDLLNSAEKGIYNSKNLTDQLLTFAKGGEPVKKIGPIQNILQESVIFALRGSNITYNFNINQDLMLLDFDEGQLNQVFSNLAINARQAMSDGGKLTISVKNILLNENEKPGLPAGNYLMITFEDNGPGIPENLLSKIFDPFFTTKKTGKGLGLTTVFSIIKKHNGNIDVESKEGVGSNFIIYLHAINSKNNKVNTDSKKEMVLKGSGKILYMDDEESILDMAVKIFSYLGYDVDVARDGSIAIDKYKEAMKSKKPYDCVILDLTVPGNIGGKEAIEHLLKIDPKVKAIVTSGYSNDTVLANYKKFGFKGAIVKPFTLKVISETLNSILLN